MKHPALILLLLLSTARAHAAQFFTNAVDVTNIIAQAVTRAQAVAPGVNAFVSVVDREGYVLGVWSVTGAGNSSLTDIAGPVPLAIAKAGTAAFLSSDQHAFSTRTAGFIVQQNYPPGVNNKPPGPLVGVNFSNLDFTDINRFKNPAGLIPAVTNGINGGPVTTPITGGLAGVPGGVPLYKGGLLIGGVGIAFDGESPANISPTVIQNPYVQEDIALAGQLGFASSPVIAGSRVTVDGVRFAYLENTPPTLGAAVSLTAPGNGNSLAAFPLTNSPVITYPPITIGGVTGERRFLIIDDPSAVPLGAARLTAAEVTAILTAGANRARTTRAGIRLPRGRPMQVFISVVNNPGNGTAPVVLGSICTSPDTTRFSWDVSVQKARTALFFSNATRAFSSRTVGFMAQSMYPPGLLNTSPGIFLGLQERFSLFPIGGVNPLNGATVTTPANTVVPGTPNPNLPNGITIFPGGFALYRAGVMIGAVGVSGDGIDQDDIVAASGAALFPPPDAIRADKMSYRGARLPYAKFPRNPAL